MEPLFHQSPHYFNILFHLTKVYESKISSLKRFNEDAREVKNGYECGIMLENFNDIKEGDVIESYEQRESKRTL